MKLERIALVGLRLGCLGILGLSAALLLHYLAPTEGAFCGVESACETVRNSALARAVSPLFFPLLGLAAYTACFWGSFWDGDKRWVVYPAVLSGIAGVGLFAYQAVVVGRFCVLCVATDCLSVFVAACAWPLRNLCRAGATPESTQGSETSKNESTSGSLDPSLESVHGWAWFLLFGLALSAPSFWPKLRAPEPLPPELEALQTEGSLTLIEFADFQCPHCRRLFPILENERVLRTEPTIVRRFHVPLPFHGLAEGAAKAALCAAQFGKEQQMIRLLFETQLNPDIWFEHAKGLGIDEEPFKTCYDSVAVAAELKRQIELFDNIGGTGLPLTFIGREVMAGSAGPERVSELFHRATRPAWLVCSGLKFWGFVAALGVALLLLGWRRSGPGPGTSAAQPAA